MEFLSFMFAFMFFLIHQGCTLEVLQQKIVVNSSELWTLPLNGHLFKWENPPTFVNQIEYIPSKSNSPDLPEWLHYSYDAYTSTGLVYGVPPIHLSSVNLDVIAWNKGQGYDVRKLLISIEIVKKEPLKYVVELKIDNMNMKELATSRRMGDLSNILLDQLSWLKVDGEKPTPIFMESAVTLGENRVPVKPNDAEGVVVHLASDADFSPEMKKLQAEVLPLWKLRPCPRDLKRTSMEKHFRKLNFLVDWCAFRLVTLTELELSEDLDKASESSVTIQNGASENNEGESGNKLREEVFYFRSEIPERDYSYEILLSTIIPGSIGGLVGFLLIVLLRTDREEDAEIDGDVLFFEAAFRTFYSFIRHKPRFSIRNNGNGNGQYIYHQAPQDAGVIVLTRDNGMNHISEIDNDDIVTETTPIPPQYAETHPNGAPALIYAV